MSLIGKEISDFTVQAYAGGEFREVKKSDILGKWAVFFFYPADFTFVCPTELEDLADKYETSSQPAARYTAYPATAILSTRHGMTHQGPYRNQVSHAGGSHGQSGQGFRCDDRG